MRCECNIYFCQLGRKVSSGKFGEQTKDNLYDITDMAKVRPAGHMRPAKLFLRPLSLRGLKIFVKLTPKNEIFEEHFWCLLGFSQIYREIFKKFCTPLPPRMNLRPPEHKNY